MTFPKPLAGLTILDFSVLLPGPFCTAILAAYGAEVIKIEPPKTGDMARLYNAEMFGALNRGKKSVVLDLKTPEARETVLRLAAKAHGVVESLRPGVMDRLGVGYDALRAVNPALVYASLSGYGQDGPYRDRAGHDLDFLALGGFFSVPIQLDGPLARPRIHLADQLGGLNAAMATAMALMQAQKSGQGTFVDASIFDAVANWSLLALLASENAGAKSPADHKHVLADMDIYETADGRALTLGTMEDKFWEALVPVIAPDGGPLADPALATRRGRDADKHRLSALLKARFREKTRTEWEALLAPLDTCWGVVYEGDEMLADPHLQARGLVVEDARGRYPAFPVNFGGNRADGLAPAPELGADTDEVLARLLG